MSDGDSSFSAFYDREFAVQVRRAGLLLDSSDEAHDVVQTSFTAVFASTDVVARRKPPGDRGRRRGAK